MELKFKFNSCHKKILFINIFLRSKQFLVSGLKFKKDLKKILFTSIYNYQEFCSFSPFDILAFPHLLVFKAFFRHFSAYFSYKTFTNQHQIQRNFIWIEFLRVLILKSSSKQLLRRIINFCNE